MGGKSTATPVSATSESVPAGDRQLADLQPLGNQAALADLQAAGASLNASARSTATSANTGARDKASSANTTARDKASGARDTLRQKHDERGKDTPSDADPLQVATFVDHDGKAPELRHDHGFLDDGSGNIDESKRREATWSDYVALAKWTAMLEGAELLRPDLVDGTSAYRHFLTGGGAQRTIDYQRFVDGDSSGATVLSSAIADAQAAAMERHDGMLNGAPAAGTTSFKMRTAAIPVGNDGRYPYPATENWQKAIGAHSIWLEMDVTVETVAVPQVGPPLPGETAMPDLFERHFTVDMTLHMEDMYNFNPGAADIATGAPDADNGRFEETGLGHEYLNVGTLKRQFTFDAAVGAPGVPPEGTAPALDDAPRTGRPADRRPYPTVR